MHEVALACLFIALGIVAGCGHLVYCRHKAAAMIAENRTNPLTDKTVYEQQLSQLTYLEGPGPLLMTSLIIIGSFVLAFISLFSGWYLPW